LERDCGYDYRERIIQKQIDTFWNPSEPTETMTFSLYGITDYQVQYWNGSSWLTVPGGTVTGNNKVWRKLAFPNLTTDKIRVYIALRSSFSLRSEFVDILKRAESLNSEQECASCLWHTMHFFGAILTEV